MEKTEANQSAFPGEKMMIDKYEISVKRYTPGLTKREYFAGLAMQGILANSAMMEDIVKQHENLRNILTAVSKDSIESADALVEQLNKPTGA